MSVLLTLPFLLTCHICLIFMSLCCTVKYIMKCDDDTFINVPNLIHVLLGGTIPIYKSTIPFYDKDSILVMKQKNRLPKTKKLLLGYKFCNAKKISDPRSKWYAPNYMFSGAKYPDYLSGTGMYKY